MVFSDLERTVNLILSIKISKLAEIGSTPSGALELANVIRAYWQEHGLSSSEMELKIDADLRKMYLDLAKMYGILDDDIKVV